MNFVIVANAWQDRLTNPTSKHHIAIELLKAGHRVLWITGTGMRRPGMFSRRDWKRAARKIMDSFWGVRNQDVPSLPRGLHVISPFVLPFPESTLARVVNNAVYLRSALKACRKLSFENAILISFLPLTPGMLRRWPGVSVYYCVDRWDAFRAYNSETMAQLHSESCRSADLVIASSTDLSKRCLEHCANVKLITHGVQHSHFASKLSVSADERPKDLPDGLIAGFIGLLSDWVDLDLIVATARAIAPSHVVLIGNADIPIEMLRKEANIHVLGPRKFQDLPSYMAFFDVGIIPFKVNELTRAVNPLKLREMMAAGVPVVSTALPEVENYADGKAVLIGQNAVEFTDYVRKLFREPSSHEQRKAISDRVFVETWESKVRKLVEEVCCITANVRTE
ncbi:MAG: glycosyltransferase [Lentisphaerae bacterium]|nr:glycosyltransferase [Lentisphaerota bacterium]